MAQLTREKITEGILEPTFNDADTGAGDKIKNTDGKTFLLLENPGASAAICTVTAQRTTKEDPAYGPLTKADLAVPVNAGETKLVGPFPSVAWSDSSGDLNLVYSGVGAADINVAPLTI